MEPNVVFKNIKGENYLRSFANVTYISQSLTDEIGIDFYEEYMDSLSMIDSNDLDENDETVFVIREQKVTVTMSKSEAVFLGKRLIERYGDEEQSEHEGDEE